MNIQNLRKAADYIKTIPQEFFDMSFYRATREDNKTPECGTIGCVVGHCTILDRKNVLDYYIDVDNEIMFSEWSVDFFKITGDEWDFCFSCSWALVDNTPQGAAKRINYLIHQGLPGNWEDMLNEEMKLCY